MFYSPLNDDDIPTSEGCSVGWLLPEQLRPWAPESSPYRPPIPLERCYPALSSAHAHTPPPRLQGLLWARAALSLSVEALTGLAGRRAGARAQRGPAGFHLLPPQPRVFPHSRVLCGLN